MDYISMFPEYYRTEVEARDYEEHNILVVEDDPFWQRVLRRNIEHTAPHCNISFVTSAEEAMAKLDMNEDFHLIVADQYLEGAKTGYDLWQTCSRRGLPVAFLLTSGNSDFQEVQNLPVRFVPKPFVAAELRNTLTELLAKPQALGAPFQYSEQILKFSLYLMTAFLIGTAIFIGGLDLNSDKVEVQPPLKERVLAPPPPLEQYKSFGDIGETSTVRESVHGAFNRPAANSSFKAQAADILVDHDVSVDELAKQQSRLRLFIEPARFNSRGEYGAIQ